MKRFNLYFPGETLPPGAKWITADALREIIFVEPGPEMFGGAIPAGILAAKPTRYKRPNRKRGWMARVMAQAKRKRGWLDRIRGTFPELPETMSGM